MTAGGAGGNRNWEWALAHVMGPGYHQAGWDMHAPGWSTPRSPRWTLRRRGPGLAKSWAYAATARASHSSSPGLTFTDGHPLTPAAGEGEHRARQRRSQHAPPSCRSIKSVVVKQPGQLHAQPDQVDYQVPDLLAGQVGCCQPGGVQPRDHDPRQPVGVARSSWTSYVPDSHANWFRIPATGTAGEISWPTSRRRSASPSDPPSPCSSGRST